MHSLWSQLAGIRRALSRRKAIFLFDFDGTLAPIAADPSRARLPEATWTALERLVRSTRVTLAIVSGRSVAELRSLVGLRNISYIGSHGLEWALRAGRRQLWATPAQCRLMRQMANQLRRTLRGHPGVLVERKVASVAVHFRNANLHDGRTAVAEVRRVAMQHVPQLTLLKGKKVIELLPAGTNNRGATVKTLLSRLRGRRLFLAAYFGDDVSDETVFCSLRKDDLSVLVGRPRQTCARFYLRSPGQVCRFLKQLCEIALCQ